MDVSTILQLIRAPEEEEKIAKKHNSSEYCYSFTNGQEKVSVYGYRHTYELNDVSDLEHSFRKTKPDLLLVEGTADVRVNNLLDEMDSADIIKKYGEQTYMAWVAQQERISVKSWDIPLEEQMQKIQDKHSKDAVLGWIIGQGIKHIIDSKRQQTPKMLISLLEIGFSMRAQKLQKVFNIELSEQNIQRVSKKYFGMDFQKIIYDEAEIVSTPRKKGETNNVIRSMNMLRDTHAIEVIAKEKEKYSNIFVTCGLSHAITWEPALAKLYS